MFKTKFTEKFGIKYPIMQGALGYLSTARLVAAVCNAGGLGSLAMAGVPGADALRAEIRKTKSLTDKPFAVNLPFLPGVRALPHEQMAEIIIEEKVAAVETIAAGKIPEPIFKMLKQNGVKVIHKCSKVKHALSAEEQGVDAVALLGFGADGHPGVDEITHLVQIPKAAKKLKIPLLVAGGIADARGFVAALALGADGVLMGTRFMTAEECTIHPKIRERLLEADETETVLCDVTHGIPSRRFRNKPALEVLELEKRGASLEEIVKVLSGERGSRALREGDIDGGCFGCGQVIGLIDEILPAKKIIDGIITDAQAIINRLKALVVP